MRLRLEGGKNPEHDGYAEQQELLRIFEEVMILQSKKGFTYGSAWLEQGYMGNVARVLSKCSRIKKMVWTDTQIDATEESVVDTLLDLINLGAFALINMRAGNKWGIPQLSSSKKALSVSTVGSQSRKETSQSPSGPRT